VASADRALTNANDFNGELANAVLAYIEEKDISIAGAAAYNKIKDWVTSPVLWVHKKRQDAYSQLNTLHFVHTANGRAACPVFPGDTRIVVIFVPDLEPGEEIPKRELLEHLRREAPYFMRAMLDMQLPPAMGRLRLPVVDTLNKQEAENSNNPLLKYLETKCFPVPGEFIKFNDFKKNFRDTLKQSDRDNWTDAKIKRELPTSIVYKKMHGGVYILGNLSYSDAEPGKEPKKAYNTEDDIRKSQ